MRIGYFEPWGRAWERMKLALFKPFDLHKWFAVGFTAFLAGLADGYHGSGGGRASNRMSFREFLNLPNRAWAWLMNHPGWAMAILILIVVLIAVGILVLWLSSRGKFMFLDNVVQNWAEIGKPWREYRREGDSLFLWRLVFSVIVLTVLAALLVLFFVTAGQLYEEGFGRRVPVPFLIGMGLAVLFIFIITGFISLFLNDFVVPIMYKNRLRTTQGWRQFLAILGGYPFHFFLYGLLVFILIILFVILVIVAGILTCCIGWVLLVIPYISTVVTLPVWYTFRAFSLEFLGQFGPELALFAPGAAQPESPPAEPPSS